MVSDINECEILGSCSQNCQNFNGSFKCSCNEGYLVDPQSSKSCKVAKGRVGVLFGHVNDVRLSDVIGHETKAIVEGLRSAVFLVSLAFPAASSKFDCLSFRIIITLQIRSFGQTLLKRKFSAPNSILMRMARKSF